MKASRLFIVVVVLCAACASAPAATGHDWPPMDRYGGPPLQDIENYDRADTVTGGSNPRAQPIQAGRR